MEESNISEISAAENDAKTTRKGDDGRAEPCCDRNFEQAPLGYKFKRISELMKVKANEDMKNEDLTYSQMQILLYLIHQKEDHAVNQQELCDVIQVSHPTMIGLINRMEKKELVRRRVDPENKRYRYIELTAKSVELLGKIKDRRDRNDRKIVSGFSEEEKQELNRLLSRVYENMLRDSLSAEGKSR